METDPNHLVYFGLPPLDRSLVPRTCNVIYPMIPLGFYPLIGYVAGLWGNFELRMDELLASFVAADASEDDARWQTRPFKQRKALLRKKCAKHFDGAIVTEINELLDTAAGIHWQRNLIIHGHYRVANLLTVGVYADGVHNGRMVSLPVTQRSLEKLYHDIAVLSGRLVRCVDPDAGVHSLSSAHRSQLRDFVRKHPPDLPTPQILAPRRLSSPA